MPVVLIDTNLWLHAHIAPPGDTSSELHRQAKTFLDSCAADPQFRIAITTYQIAEILDLLRKARVPEAIRRKLFDAFFAEKFVRVPVDDAALRSCVEASFQSGIHIYDYLVALPLKGIVNRIFSADDHFQHPHFTAIAPVENPVAPWRLREGTRPTRS